MAALGTKYDCGLAVTEAEQRLRRFGPNALVERGIKSPLAILFDQLKSVLIAVLLAAALISFLLGERLDSGAILAIVVLNAVLGFLQEFRAERAMAALKQLAVPQVRVRRDGQILEVSARQLVPGDVVLLESGSVVPADGRLVEGFNLEVQESALTGESEPIPKDAGASLASDTPLSERRNMVYMGTAVVKGRGVMVVTETGMQTELGRIAEMISGVRREPTPLQRRLEQLGRGLALASVAIVIVVFVLGLIRGESFRLMLLVSISMAVAAVPEGLPAVVTIALTLGARRMLARNALIRRLAAVESLGSVTVICSDKTGTLTENRMTVTVLDLAGDTLNISADRDEPEYLLDAVHRPEVALMLVAGALCSDALVRDSPESAGQQVIGDPTEGALVLAALRFGLHKSELERVLPRVGEVPFTTARRRMTTVHRVAAETDQDAPGWLKAVAAANGGAPLVAFTKGAVDSITDAAAHVWVGGRIEPMNRAWQCRAAEANSRLAGSGMRVLGIAFRPLATESAADGPDQLERNLTFVGLVAMADPVRREAVTAVDTCRRAGIRPMMITGDHPLTAKAIARVLHMETPDTIPTGQDIGRMSEAELTAAVSTQSVFARVEPEQKLAIVEALQHQGQVVAMTGDGVNDAPALKKADIGVAMGAIGTDVAKEASDMVLLDDNFATIVAAVEEGRVVYDNVRKFIKFSVGGNIGKILVVVVGPFLGMPLPLLPLQLLWLNLLTDGLLGLGLSVEPAERGTMTRPPRRLTESIFSDGTGTHMLRVGAYIGVAALALGFLFWRNFGQNGVWQTALFTTLAFLQAGQAVAVRTSRDSVFGVGLLSNRAQALTVLLVLGLQLAAVYVPVMQRVFRTVPLSPGQLAACAAVGSVAFWAVEIEKLVGRRRGG